MRLGHASSVHTNGDSWDSVAIAPEPTKAQDAKVDELTRQKGLKTGLLRLSSFASSLPTTPIRLQMVLSQRQISSGWPALW
jgi:hypothetical protein